jgi:hypothetical protein
MTLDVIVLGSGSAAQNVAYTCRASSRSVVVVDSRPFGGTCELRGCDPKKVLVGVAELVDWSRRMQGKGVSAPGLSLNWPDMIRFKRTFTDPVPAHTERGFAEVGITTRHGRARFVGRTTVQVGDETLLGRQSLGVEAYLKVLFAESVHGGDQMAEGVQFPAGQQNTQPIGGQSSQGAFCTENDEQDRLHLLDHLKRLDDLGNRYQPLRFVV